MENRAVGIETGLEYKISKKKLIKDKFYQISVYLILIAIWQYLSKSIGIPLLLPTPASTANAFLDALKNAEIMTNLLITMGRIAKGFMISIGLGVPLGLLMGLSPLSEKMFGGIIDSVRQVPIMAWVPLSIIWLGIGEGPTIFMIAIAGIFPVILNTVQGVQNISKDYYNAAKSMGAGNISIFRSIIIPASLPDMMTGARLALSNGWMSVICAEFIATSSGLGYSMVEAQVRMQTNLLIALMFISAFVGYGIDRGIRVISGKLTKWRSEQ